MLVWDGRMAGRGGGRWCEGVHAAKRALPRRQEGVRGAGVHEESRQAVRNARLGHLVGRGKTNVRRMQAGREIYAKIKRRGREWPQGVCVSVRGDGSCGPVCGGFGGQTHFDLRMVCICPPSCSASDISDRENARFIVPNTPFTESQSPMPLSCTPVLFPLGLFCAPNPKDPRCTIR